MISSALKTKWIDAARNPNNTQMRGKFMYPTMRGDGGFSYCILGLLGKVMAEADGVLCPSGYYDSSAYVPKIGMMLGEDTCRRLIYLNDRNEWSFDEIANWIHHNIPAQPEPRPRVLPPRPRASSPYEVNFAIDLMCELESQMAKQFKEGALEIA